MGFYNPGRERSRIRDIHHEAEVFYNTLPMHERFEGYMFFCSLDLNRDWKISWWELAAVASPRYRVMIFENFNVLDLDGNGSLDFWECVTLYYILKVPGKICRRCERILLEDTYCGRCGVENDPLQLVPYHPGPYQLYYLQHPVQHGNLYAIVPMPPQTDQSSRFWRHVVQFGIQVASNIAVSTLCSIM